MMNYIHFKVKNILIETKALRDEPITKKQTGKFVMIQIIICFKDMD